MSLFIASKNCGCLSDSIDDYPEGIVIPVDKPYRWTSADVVRKLKFCACRHFGKKGLKVGHAGTLDPLAQGVLLVCIGKATKLAETFQKHDKEYLAGISFGATTPSYDLEKEIDKLYPTSGVSEASIRAVLPSFLGEQEQIAPLFSAKSVDGVRAYELARKNYKAAIRTNGEFDHSCAELLSKQLIRINSIDLIGFYPSGKTCPAPHGIPDETSPIHSGASSPLFPNDEESPRPQESSVAQGTQIGFGMTQECSNPRNSRIKVTDNSSLHLPHADILVSCSKGTYIRALARDLGEALGSGAHLDSLCRTRTGNFSLEDALTPDEAVRLFRPRQ